MGSPAHFPTDSLLVRAWTCPDLLDVPAGSARRVAEHRRLQVACVARDYFDPNVSPAVKILAAEQGHLNHPEGGHARVRHQICSPASIPYCQGRLYTDFARRGWA